jgi:hypothetical protein
MKLYEFTRYNPLDDDMQQTLIFAPNEDVAYQELYGYPVPAGDPRRSWWAVKDYPIKKGELKLTLF